MPELPEVETIRRDLHRGILHKTIQRIDIIDGRILRQPAKDFVRRLKGRTIEDVSRRGKALVLALDSGEHLVVQVMMTGQMVVNGQRGPHTRIIFEFSDGKKVFYNDQRVFGQLRVVKNTDEIKYFRVIGPEPFDKAFDERYISGRLKRSLRPIKNVLLDHVFVAGVGNIYACEILFRCGISPKRRAARIKSAEAPLLRRHTMEVLEQAIAARGSSIRNYRDGDGNKGTFNAHIRVYGKEGQPCPGCGKPVARIVQAGRSTFYCVKCQK